jgi:hypothetical protein
VACCGVVSIMVEHLYDNQVVVTATLTGWKILISKPELIGSLIRKQKELSHFRKNRGISSCICTSQRHHCRQSDNYHTAGWPPGAMGQGAFRGFGQWEGGRQHKRPLPHANARVDPRSRGHGVVDLGKGLVDHWTAPGTFLARNSPRRLGAWPIAY